MNPDKNILKRHAKGIYAGQFFEHGAFGRGLGITLDQTDSPHNILLGDMPYSSVEEDDDDDELEGVLDHFIERNQRALASLKE